MINSGIPEDYGTIYYNTVSEVTAAIQTLGSSCLLVKRDFENAFWHISISPIDVPLLGFESKRKYYAEPFLPFGLRTESYFFSLFAEVFHFILTDVLGHNAMPAKNIHYLDDILIILPHQCNCESYSRIFSELSTRVGLSIKESKSEQETVASFGGVEFDTEHMVIRLPIWKLNKAQNLVETAMSQNSISLLELQTLTGYLNFVSIVAPLGRTFLRRLYNMQLYFPVGKSRHRGRISGQGILDLRWWLDALERKSERSIQKPEREVISLWTDAASTRVLGGYYIDVRKTASAVNNTWTTVHTPNKPHPGTAFSLSLLRHL